MLLVEYEMPDIRQEASLAVSVFSWLRRYIAVGVLTLVPFAAAGMSSGELARYVQTEFHRQFGTNAQIDAALLKMYGVPVAPEKLAVAREALKGIIFHKAMPDYVAKLVLPIYRPDISKEEVASAMFQGVMQMQVKGLARLPAERQATFVRHVLGMARWSSPSECKAMFLGQMKEQASAALERRYVASLPLSQFHAVTILYRDAAEAELGGFPDARTVSAEQASLAERAYNAASAKRVRQYLPADLVRRVLAAPEEAPAREVCDVISTSAEGMLDLAEPYRSWQFTRFVQSMR